MTTASNTLYHGHAQSVPQALSLRLTALRNEANQCQSYGAEVPRQILEEIAATEAMVLDYEEAMAVLFKHWRRSHDSIVRNTARNLEAQDWESLAV